MKRILIIVFIFINIIGIAANGSDHNSIYAWIDGQYTCYQLSSMPKVSYSGSQAILSFSDNTTPLVLELSQGSVLKITFGVYIPTNVQETDQPVKQVGKYIRGGHLVIVKDGKLYDVNGQIIQ